MNERKGTVTYTVRGMDRNRHGCYIVWEHLDGCAVNEYTAYDKGDEFVLYPRTKLMASSLSMKKKTIGIREAKRAF